MAVESIADRQLLWNFRHVERGHECTAHLTAVWEADFDSMSDDFDPLEISASSLFMRWARRVSKKYTDGLIPISWFVDVSGGNCKTFEFMPFQLVHFPMSVEKDFLTFFTWPQNANSGDLLNWFELPIADKLWHSTQAGTGADKGGFIQEATGWKPSILQPYLYLPSLEKAATG